ncbi:DUF6374 family protein [Nocardia ninae]
MRHSHRAEQGVTAPMAWHIPQYELAIQTRHEVDSTRFATRCPTNDTPQYPTSSCEQHSTDRTDFSMRPTPPALDLSRIAFAQAQIDEVRRQLLDTAAFGKSITPDQLEHLAAKLGETLRILAEDG